jgi:hypothetical protein
MLLACFALAVYEEMIRPTPSWYSWVTHRSYVSYSNFKYKGHCGRRGMTYLGMLTILLLT